MRVSQVTGLRTIDLNVDIGEGFPFDEQLLAFASSANICCGVHAGSRELTQETIALCHRHRVRIGVHPGYPDRVHMGRKAMEPGQEREYLKSVFDQTAWFLTVAEPAYMKPHGAFYGDTGIVLPSNWQKMRKRTPSQSDYEGGGAYLAQFPGIQSLMMMLRIHRLPLMGLAATAHREISRRANQELIIEGFADRKLHPNGTLFSRSAPGAILQEPKTVRQQVLNLADSVDSICLHGDTPNCLELAELVYSTLQNAGYGVGPA